MSKADDQPPYRTTLLHLPLSTIFASLSVSERLLITRTTNLTSDSLTILLTSTDLLAYAATPDVVWREAQQMLAGIYVTTLTAAYDAGRPLLDVTVVFETWCGYDLVAEREEGWDTMVGTKEDESYLHSLNARRAANSLPTLPLHVIDVALSFTVPPMADLTHSVESASTYNHVAVGGTFDHLHAGHKILLTMTAWLAGKRAICGVTDDSMLLKKDYRKYIEPVEDRVKNVERFLHTIRRGIVYEVVSISDPYGPTITDATIEALVVSRETLKGGDAVNVERAKREFLPLKIRVIDVISSSEPSLEDVDSMALKISSSWIRKYLWEQEHGRPEAEAGDK